MGLILKAVASKSAQPKMNHSHNFVGVPSFAQQNPGYSFLNAFDSEAYASIYPSVKAITYEFKKIQPFAINGNGKPVDNAPVIRALYHPNQADSSVAFFEKLAVMNLTHAKTYVLVWRKEGNETFPGGTINPNNIGGFTFLERPGVTRRDGKTYYNIGAQEFNENEVMVIPGGVDPQNLYGGYSPGEASRRWATLDDYIADYQKGFFENGAIPAGQFVITAATDKDFNDTVDRMQAKHRGAGNNNNVTYTPQPIDPTTGKPGEAKIQWIPFASSNKDIDFKNLFEQANNRIDSAFGVPASIRGVGENNNYATARIDQQNFIIRVVEPLALSIYTQITHELNRITNGLGVAVTFKLPIPAIADEEKVQAETKNIEVAAISSLMAQGFSLDSAVDALNLSPRYKLLKVDATTKTVIDNDKPDVDEGGEVLDSPDPDKVDGITPLNKKKVRQIKNELTDLEKLENVARELMQSQVDKAIEDYDKDQDITNAVTGAATKAAETKFVEDMLVHIIAIMVAEGAIEYAVGIKLVADAGLSTANLQAFVLNESARASYEAYLSKVGMSYGADTAEAIQSVLARSNVAGWTRVETQNALRGIMNTDEWRVKRIGVTELNRSQALSGVEAMKQIQAESGATLEKALLHTGGDPPCEFCATLIGKWVAVDQELVPLGSTIVGADGGIMINDFVANDGYDPHPNGHCVSEYRVVTT